MIVGARADPALVIHPIQRYLIHALFKKSFRGGCTTALIEHTRYILFAVLDLSAEGIGTFPDIFSVLLDHCKFVTQSPQVLLLLRLLMWIDGIFRFQMRENSPVSRDAFEFKRFLEILLDQMTLKGDITRFIKSTNIGLVYLMDRFIIRLLNRLY